MWVLGGAWEYFHTSSKVLQILKWVRTVVVGELTGQHDVSGETYPQGESKALQEQFRMWLVHRVGTNCLPSHPTQMQHCTMEWALTQSCRADQSLSISSPTWVKHISWSSWINRKSLIRCEIWEQDIMGASYIKTTDEEVSNWFKENLRFFSCGILHESPGNSLYDFVLCGRAIIFCGLCQFSSGSMTLQSMVSHAHTV